MFVASALLALSACGSSPPDPVKALGEDSSMAQIISANPELEAKVKAALAERGGPGMFGDAKKEVAGVATPIVNDFINARMDAMDDAMIARYAGIMAKRTLETIASGDDCTRPTRGNGETSMMTEFGSDDMKPFFVDLARMQPVPDGRKATEQEVQAFMGSNVEQIAAAGGLPLDRTQAIMYGQKGSTVEECRMSAGTFGRLSTMPAAESGPILRALRKQR